jgi:putative transcriptional regulator
MQHSPLALKQIRAVLNEINHSSRAELQERSQKLLDKYFPEAELKF